MTTLLLLLSIATAWGAMEMQWREDRRWADESWRLGVWAAHWEVADDEARWAR